MKNKIPQAVAIILLASAMVAQDAKPTGGQGSQATPVRAQVEITNLLREFLAHVDDPAMHERFWADDVVYTSGLGVVRSKAEIVKSVRAGGMAPLPNAADVAKDSFSAEDIMVRQYGDTATLTFRLVHQLANGKKENYRNSGMFVKHDDKWQVVTWQATKVPEEAPKVEVKKDEKPDGKK